MRRKIFESVKPTAGRVLNKLIFVTRRILSGVWRKPLGIKWGSYQEAVAVVQLSWWSLDQVAELGVARSGQMQGGVGGGASDSGSEEKGEVRSKALKSGVWTAEMERLGVYVAELGLMLRSGILAVQGMEAPSPTHVEALNGQLDTVWNSKRSRSLWKYKIWSSWAYRWHLKPRD